MYCYCLWALEEGGVSRTGLLPAVAPTLQGGRRPGVLRHAVCTDRGMAGDPEEVVPRERALTLIGVVC
ncbi:hypothetical protein [Streptomyces ipomoeae]|uniref:Uncharacterized protein n=1 Tax=Streptomyces ipomoeae 91-03 TaxID=698759 RepID=L1L512_9ACTN|nr:hypothetical protein [Streptomyces ipomoeae]EKX68017.1 hypothetical protein STRIP9103_06182 [Streptomyces ipomoeae 91-03]MDX2700374.1 hypothetical protein [Streptomyces ipomoeae]MDX2846030.1 hypothetical protein [Streptomyces ipomoeae]MDX2931871.1 hypothetical protein [Streptomyces ipomoeae]